MSLAGQVKLDGAVLFVDGDLSVGGSLVGKGAVIVTGTTTITGSATLATDNMAAILSAGEVIILGQGDERSTFRGMVYTESNFTARNLSLYGISTANGGADSVVSIQDSRLIHVPDYAEVSFTPKQSSSDGITSDMTFYFQTEGEYHGYHEPKRGRHLRIRVVREQDGSYTAYDLQDGDSDNQPDTSTILPSIADALEDHIEEDEMEEFYETSGPFVDILRQMPRTGGGTSPGDGDENKFPSPEPSFEFDPMEFLKPEERIRLVLWRLR